MPTAVLVVEDDPTIRETLVSLFVDEGFDVAGLDTVEATREAVNQGGFACVLLDLYLLDGAAHALLAEWELDALAPDVVVVSAANDAPAVARQHAVTLITKPVLLDVVLGAVQSTIANRVRPPPRATAALPKRRAKRQS